jgi:hypothetical protein
VNPKVDQPVYSCITKAIVADGNQLRTGPKWVTSRRGRLKLFGDRLECGDWTIPYVNIREAVLSSFRSPILRIPGYLLAVRTDSDTYHFGLNGGRYWEGELPFPVQRQKARLKMSMISIVARVLLIGYALYVVWGWATSG